MFIKGRVESGLNTTHESSIVDDQLTRRHNSFTGTMSSGVYSSLSSADSHGKPTLLPKASNKKARSQKSTCQSCVYTKCMFLNLFT
jgi:hypothetical protein